MEKVLGFEDIVTSCKLIVLSRRGYFTVRRASSDTCNFRSVSSRFMDNPTMWWSIASRILYSLLSVDVDGPRADTESMMTVRTMSMLRQMMVSGFWHSSKAEVVSREWMGMGERETSYVLSRIRTWGSVEFRR